MDIVPADARYRGSHDGISSWHCFSAGSYYEPDNVSWGGLIGYDEHLLAPGTGFEWHAHRHVDIVSWVLSGTLRHEDTDGRVLIVSPGQVLVQSCGTGIRHKESNPSLAEPLRLVQATLLADSDEREIRLGEPPIEATSARMELWTGPTRGGANRWHAFVGTGSWQLGDVSLEPGDSARGGGSIEASGSGDLLMWLLD